MRAEGMQYMFRALFCFAAVLLAHTAQADGLKVLWWQVGDFTASDPLANVPVELVFEELRNIV